MLLLLLLLLLVVSHMANASLSTAAAALPQTTDGERLCRALAQFRASNTTATSNATLSLALFTTAEQHVIDVAGGVDADCSLWSWSARGDTLWTPCCLALDANGVIRINGRRPAGPGR